MAGLDKIINRLRKVPESNGTHRASPVQGKAMRFWHERPIRTQKRGGGCVGRDRAQPQTGGSQLYSWRGEDTAARQARRRGMPFWLKSRDSSAGSDGMAKEAGNSKGGRDQCLLAICGGVF